MKLCLVPGCERRHGSHLLMCFRCWRALPRRLQQAVYQAFDRGRGYSSPAYEAAKAAAVEHATQQLHAGRA